MPKYRGYPSWSNRTHVEGSHRQHAYSDTSEYVVPVVVIPGASVEDALTDAAALFRASPAAQPGSSWGALRWSGGCRILRTELNPPALVVQETICLCD